MLVDQTDFFSAYPTLPRTSPPTLAQVSHDQFLIEATVDELWMCEGGHVQPFHGTFAEYKARLRVLAKSS